MRIGKLNKTITRISLKVDQVSKKIKPNKIKHKSKGVHFMIKCRSVILRISNKVRKDLQST